MSSNISIPKVCNHCGKTYIAHKTTTRYCSHKCNSRDYKLKAKQDKIEKTLLEQQNARSEDKRPGTREMVL